MIWNRWKRYRFCRLVAQVRAMKANPPKTYEEWQTLASKSELVQTIGVYEEYKHVNIYFYRQSVSGACSFQKTTDLIQFEKRQKDKEEEEKLLEGSPLSGFTLYEISLIIRLQGLFRGILSRCRKKRQRKASQLADAALEVYLRHPEVDENLYNYALYCHVILDDIPRARALYAESFRRMRKRGPDVSFVLYSYAVFSFVNRESDSGDIYLYLQSAREAELQNEVTRRRNRTKNSVEVGEVERNFEYGRSYKLATYGFYQRTAESQNTCNTWHNYAACLYLIYGRFDEAFIAFERAFSCDALNTIARNNFDIMMQRYYGNDDKVKSEVIRGFANRIK